MFLRGLDMSPESMGCMRMARPNPEKVSTAIRIQGKALGGMLGGPGPLEATCSWGVLSA